MTLGSGGPGSSRFARAVGSTIGVGFAGAGWAIGFARTGSATRAAAAASATAAAGGSAIVTRRTPGSRPPATRQRWMAMPDSSSSDTMLAGNSTPAWRSSEKLTGLPAAVRKRIEHQRLLLVGQRQTSWRCELRGASPIMHP